MDAEGLKTGKYIGVPVDTGLSNECVRRSKEMDFDLASLLETLLIKHLNENNPDSVAWQMDGLDPILRTVRDEQVERCGSPREGYQWQTLFLPNGTRLMAKYKGKPHYAEVQHSKIVDDAGSYSPSEWASKVANHTSRNAWRDIYVQDPITGEFCLADVLRHKKS